VLFCLFLKLTNALSICTSSSGKSFAISLGFYCKFGRKFYLCVCVCVCACVRGFIFNPVKRGKLLWIFRTPLSKNFFFISSFYYTVRSECRCALKLRYVTGSGLHRRSWKSLPTPFKSAQRLSERTVQPVHYTTLSVTYVVNHKILLYSVHVLHSNLPMNILQSHVHISVKWYIRKSDC
jgi:hypothetical protein